MGSQIQARPLGAKVQPGEEHPGPGVPLLNPQGFPLSLLPTYPRIWVETSAGCTGLAYLEPGEEANDMRPRVSCVGGLLMFFRGGFVTLK